eukprot:635290_1
MQHMLKSLSPCAKDVFSLIVRSLFYPASDIIIQHLPWHLLDYMRDIKMNKESTFFIHLLHCLRGGHNQSFSTICHVLYGNTIDHRNTQTDAMKNNGIYLEVIQSTLYYPNMNHIHQKNQHDEHEHNRIIIEL